MCILSAGLSVVTIGCPGVDPGAGINPFRDLPDIRLNGQAQDMTNDIAPLGTLAEGDVVRVRVEGEMAESMLLLAEDAELEAAGVVVGGGGANESLEYRIPRDGRYFAFVLFSSDASAIQRRATITAEVGDFDFQPPTAQTVVISFEENYLSADGLFDPDSQDEDDRAFLESISEQVREQIIARLETIFADTPIDIVDERDGTPDGPVSRVTFSPQRKSVDADSFSIDAVLPGDATRPECQDAVVYGEVISNSMVDVGNRRPDDEAVVYVGSFQGRGETCRTAVTDSINTIVLGLSQTAAHEIGHLLGLYHGALQDLMTRSVSQAFQRELDFTRQQILIEVPAASANGEPTIETVVLTGVIQDPIGYFEAIFVAP